MTKAGGQRAIFVINSLAGGGAERVFTTLVRHSGAMRDRFVITVVLLDDEVHEAYSLPEWVQVIRLNCRGSLLRSIMRLRTVVWQVRPDVMLSFLTRANVASVVAARTVACRTVISERVNTAAHLATGRLAAMSRAMVRWVYPRADHVVAVSHGVGQTLSEAFSVPADHIRVISNPIDVQAIRKLGAEPDALGATGDDWVTMGRLVPNKNAALAIRAFAASQLPGRLIILGDGPMRCEWEELARRSGLGERVVFAGFQANPYAVIARCRAYILPSNAEGFPNAMVEAMALGVPVIATNCPSGPAEILDIALAGESWVEGRGGLLVPIGSSDAMASAMGVMMKEEVRTRLSRAAHQRVEDYSVEKAVTLFWEVMLEPASR